MDRMTFGAQSMTLAWQTIWTPDRAFGSFGERPSWLALFVLLCLANTAFSTIMFPYAERAAITQLEARTPSRALDADQQGQVRRQVLIGERVGMLVGPIFLLMKWAAVAAVFWAIAVLAGRDVPFPRLLAMVMYASIPLMLGSFFGYGIVMAKGIDAIHSLRDLKPLIGLNAFVQEQGAAIDAALSSINVFDAWYVVLLAIGLRQVGTFGRKTAIGVALGFWVAATSVQIALASVAASLMAI